MRLFLIAVVLFASCASVKVNDPNIKVHWIKQGERTPFNGVLLNKYTFYRLLKKAQEAKQCRKAE